MSNLLIVDDDSSILKLMSEICRRNGHSVTSVESGKEALDCLNEKAPDLLIVDLILEDINGIKIVENCQKINPSTQIIMVTGHGSVETAVEAMKLGVFDYITKPFQISDFETTVSLAIQNKNKNKKSQILNYEDFNNKHEFIGKSEEVNHILDIVNKISNNPFPVLLEGELGSGKELIARLIHNSSNRKSLPFKYIQCSSLSENLLETELFGNSNSVGETIFTRAMGGTVMIEEIDLLPIKLQAKLNHYMEQVSSIESFKKFSDNLNFRLISSSVNSLLEKVESGKFRQDLYYKLSVIPIEIPPLRSRIEDIEMLCDYFLKQHSKRTNSPLLKIDSYAKKFLKNYKWPGNINELQNAIEQASSFAKDGCIMPSNLPPKITQNSVKVNKNEGSTYLPIGDTLSNYIKHHEKLFIGETLNFTNGSREKASSILGISIATLYRKMGFSPEKTKK